MTLTDAQLEIASLPPESRALVIAGAGTGKTRVLAARLAILIERHGLAPGSDVLVLSFSRAAVAEIKRRLKSTGSDIAYASASTFDSFATALLCIIRPDEAWLEWTYDERIEAVAHDIEQGGPAVDEVRRYRHVLIDEVQDLVGPRIRLVRSILGVCGGFTLFGDPAQSIYDHQAPNGSKDQCAALLEFIRETWKSGLVERELLENFRAKTAETRDLDRYGSALRASDADVLAVRKELRSLVLALMPIGSLAAFAVPLSERSVTTAILCRNNAQALLISRHLHELRIEHKLQREATDRVASGWIAASLQGIANLRTSKTRLLSRLRQQEGSTGLAAASMWALLKLLDPRRGDELDLQVVAARLRSRSIPEELNHDLEARVVVSTIHRAKGLEFDRILLVESGSDGDENLAEETRLLYVALSRAASAIFVMSPPDTRGLRRDPTAGGRLVRRGYGRNSWRISAIEVRGDDTHSADPLGCYCVEDIDPCEAQTYLNTEVQIGDPVSMVLLRATVDGAPRAVFAVVHKTKVVAVTSESFAADLFVALGRRMCWPRQITNLFVEAVDSVAGSERVGSSAGLGEAGIWNRVRVSGLGELIWKDD